MSHLSFSLIFTKTFSLIQFLIYVQKNHLLVLPPSPLELKQGQGLGLGQEQGQGKGKGQEWGQGQGQGKGQGLALNALPSPALAPVGQEAVRHDDTSTREACGARETLMITRKVTR